MKSWSYAALCVLSCACARAEPPRSLSEPLARRALTTYADIALASYGDALHGAQQLATALAVFVAEPDEAKLAAARASWRAARRPYLQTEAFRFYDGPIDRVELLVNTWPIDEGYVEGVLADPERYPQLDAALLESLNARDGETSISTGYHVIEFLLWGRDRNADGPGARAASEFAGAGTLATRLRAYLQQAGALLAAQLAQVHAAWNGPYRAQFVALPGRQGLQLALRGLGSLSGPELAGERLTVPYETRDPENEQSCFSDTTHEDVLYDARGMQNLCLGRYRKEDGNVLQGVGLCSVIAELDPPLGHKLEQQIARSVQAAERIPAPFDRALSGPDTAPGRLAIKATIDALQDQTDAIARALARVGP